MPWRLLDLSLETLQESAKEIDAEGKAEVEIEIEMGVDVDGNRR